jgi:hypothetical protein
MRARRPRVKTPHEPLPARRNEPGDLGLRKNARWAREDGKHEGPHIAAEKRKRLPKLRPPDAKFSRSTIQQREERKACLARSFFYFSITC